MEKIQSINFKNNLLFYKNKKTSLSFSGQKLLKGQFLKDNEIYNKDTTFIFRTDLDWVNFGEYLKERFKNYNKINTYIYGCSNGSEAYSLSILLQDADDNYKKFFPINAMDIDNETILQNIKEQKNMVLRSEAAVKLPMVLKRQSNDIKKYISYINGFDVALNENVVRDINFRQANILEDIDFINSDAPSIVMCRNMWPYIDKKEYDEYIKSLYDKLSKNSCVVIGEFDIEDKIQKDAILNAFNKAGFENMKMISNNSIKTTFDTIIPKVNLNKNAELIFEKNHG